MIINDKSVPVHHWDLSLWYRRTFTSAIMACDMKGYPLMALWADEKGRESVLRITFGMENDIRRAGLLMSEIKGQTVRMRKRQIHPPNCQHPVELFDVEIVS